MRVVVALLLPVIASCAAAQRPAHSASEHDLREYAGVYQWGPGSHVYLQLWNELSGSNQLVAVDESGLVRTLYPVARDRFETGSGAAVATPVEARVTFERDASDRLTGLRWDAEDGSPRMARRVEIERQEAVSFANGAIRLAGTLIRPAGDTRRLPAMILVHGSGPGTREQILPFARFLVRRGLVVLTYDKRGVGGSTGDWTTATFDDLASDVIAAFKYLKTRDVDTARIGVFGVSQAGWIMPLAAVREPGIAFLISVSGAGVPASETTIDHARAEMTANGLKPETIDQMVNIMRLQNEYARTGEGWDAYLAARSALAARFGRPPDNFPASRDHPIWGTIRRLYLYDPAPTLRRLRTPTLALFGELDNNVLAEKNLAAWRAALDTSANGEFRLRVIPGANHIHLEARIGSNSEMSRLQRFAPAYYRTILDWLEEQEIIQAASP